MKNILKIYNICIHKKYLILIIFLFFLFTSCVKNSSVTPVVTVPPQETDVQFIGHKGGGSTGYNYHYIENTLPSIINGLQTLNGAEVDLQMSLDGTIWIYHNEDISSQSCDTSFHHCILLLHDSVISKVHLCELGLTDRLYKLSELIDYWNSTSNGFYISLHVKADFTSDTINKVGGLDTYLTNIAVSLAKVLKVVNHSGQLMTEIEALNNDNTYRNKIKSLVPGIKCCLINYSIFKNVINVALSGGYDGISCNFTDTTATTERLKIVQDSGLIVQMWTPYTKDELLSALNRHPNFIQTDNLTAIKDLNLKVIAPASKGNKGLISKR